MDDRQYTRECDPKIVGRGGTVTARGMTVAWRLSPGTVEFSVHWPSRGWAAIGINPRSGLPGTQLMMVSVVDGRGIVSDRHILAAGDHRPVRELGGVDHVAVREAHCDASGCRAVLVAARAPRDAWHHALVDGLAYFMLLAYSAEPDFDHHSLFRTEVPLMLLPSATTP